MNAEWEVELSREAKKQYKKLATSGLKRPFIIDVIDALVLDLESRGPVLDDWPHYGIIHKNKKEFYHHCHLRQWSSYVCCLLGS